MRIRVTTVLATALLCLAPTASWADLSPYSQDFEGLAPAPQELPETSLGGDGWRFFANGFDAFGNYLFGYGPFDAPNHGEAISAVVAGEGAVAQGAQQLSVFSNYFDPVHGACNPPGDSSSPTCIFLETNVFKEQVVGAGDVGATWRFQFDAKRGNIGGATTARAFFKTLNPAAGYALTNFIWIDMTNVPTAWDSYALFIYIDPSLQGQILQFGFLNTATAYEGSGVFYDNINLGVAPLAVSLDIKPGSCPNPLNAKSQGVLPVAVLGTGNFDVSTIDPASLRLEGVAPIRWDYEDVAAPFTGDLCGCNESGPDGNLDLTLKFDTMEIMYAIAGSGGGDVVMTLTGALFDGTAIEGLDCVLIVPAAGGKRPMSVLDGEENRTQRLRRNPGQLPDVDTLRRRR